MNLKKGVFMSALIFMLVMGFVVRNTGCRYVLTNIKMNEGRRKMIVDAKINTYMKIDIDPEEAFRILCRSLDMEYVLSEDYDFSVRKNSYGENLVYRTVNGRDNVFDDRADLFIALRNVAVNMFPNLLFRSADYIYTNQKRKRGLANEEHI